MSLLPEPSRCGRADELERRKNKGELGELAHKQFYVMNALVTLTRAHHHASRRVSPTSPPSRPVSFLRVDTGPQNTRDSHDL